MTQNYQLIASHASQYPIIVLCRVLGLARSGDYAWPTRVENPRRQADRRLLVQIAASFRARRHRYGSPRVHADVHEGGVRCARKRVARLMRQAGLRASAPRRQVRTADSRHQLAVAANLLKREFRATAPDQKWVADITYLPTKHGWVELAAVLDLFSRRVIGRAVRSTLERELVVTALQRALVQRKPDPGLLHHSDRGSQYARCEYQQQLERSQQAA
jgi:putative transposase